MRRTIALLTTMAMMLLVATSVALAAVISCPSGDAGFCTGTGSNDTMTGTNIIDYGNDDASATTPGDQIYGLGGNDHLYGRGASDALHGGYAYDWLDGGEGNDQYWFEDGWGEDTITADASGYDTLRFDKLTKAVTVQLVQNSFRDEAGYTVPNHPTNAKLNWVPTVLIESVWGGSGSDTLSGNNGKNYLYGAGGNDKLDGGAGRDSLNGGPGNDTIDAADQPGGEADGSISCGAGSDTLYYDRGFDVPVSDCEKKIGFPIAAPPN